MNDSVIVLTFCVLAGLLILVGAISFYSRMQTKKLEKLKRIQVLNASIIELEDHLHSTVTLNLGAYLEIAIKSKMIRTLVELNHLKESRELSGRIKVMRRDVNRLKSNEALSSAKVTVKCPVSKYTQVLRLIKQMQALLKRELTYGALGQDEYSAGVKYLNDYRVIIFMNHYKTHISNALSEKDLPKARSVIGRCINTLKQFPGGAATKYIQNLKKTKASIDSKLKAESDKAQKEKQDKEAELNQIFDPRPKKW